MDVAPERLSLRGEMDLQWYISELVGKKIGSGVSEIKKKSNRWKKLDFLGLADQIMGL